MGRECEAVGFEESKVGDEGEREDEEEGEEEEELEEDEVSRVSIKLHLRYAFAITSKIPFSR